jgi:alcohol dehydrogenase (cytochrome c)
VTGLYYLGINNSCMEAKVVSTPYVLGRAYTGVTITAKRAPGYDYVGEFVAFNPVTGKRAWTYRSPSGAAMTASALATAGGIVFGGTANREFFALNSDTGELLWQTRLNGDVSGAPITFDVGGTQYVAITAGGRTGPTTSFGPLTNVTLSEGTGAVWVFAASSNADARLSSRNAATPVLTSTSGTPGLAGAQEVAARAEQGVSPVASAAAVNGVFTSAQASRGEQQFKQACAACHAIDEQAGSLRSKWGNATLADLFTTISTTMPQNNPGSLSRDAYASIVAYYLQRSGQIPGAADLPADAAALKQIRITPN